jgi:N-sulfoglucosamine sulfohydrolase
VAIAQDRPNLLVITVDDMNADSVGVFGSALHGTTPRIDALAARGLRFDQAHVQVANCKPSRNVMWTGRYPHSNRVEGFYSIWDAAYPTLMQVLSKAGYFTAIRNKLKHSTPSYPFPWDLELDTEPDGGIRHEKDPASYGASVVEGIKAARASGKPFFLMINIADPHLPFFGEDKAGNRIDDAYRPSRTFSPNEVPVPGFLYDSEIVRQELAQYFSTVRRADDAVGSVLSALESSGSADSTVVLFLSDHGMPLPFAKTQLYHHSTRTPLIIKWPGVTRPGTVDDRHLVSAVDLLPTILEGLGIGVPDGVQGRSFFALLRGQQLPDRDKVFKAYNENAAGQRAPMRAVQTSRLLYIFNPWSAPPPPEILRPWLPHRFTMRSAAMGTDTWQAMADLSRYDLRLAWRVDLFRHRVPEELYDVQADPDCLENLVHDPRYAQQLAALRSDLEHWMRETGDHALAAFEHRDDPAFLARYMDRQQAQSRQRKIDARRRRDELILRAMIDDGMVPSLSEGGADEAAGNHP